MEAYLELTGWLVKLLPALTSALLVAAWWAARRARPWLGRLVTVGLLLAGLGAALVYVQPQVKKGAYYNTYEMIHYYLPTHYANEIRYTGLYDAIVAASEEQGFTPVDSVRNLKSGEIKSYRAAVARMEKARARFSPKRWDEWKSDVAWFNKNMSPGTWAKALVDRGYNATPIYTMVAKLFADRVHAGVRSFELLAAVDVVWWLTGLGLTLWAFGPRALGLALVVMAVHYVNTYNTLKAGFMRADWVACLIGALALDKKGRPAAAGVMVAYAGLMRVFPFVYAFGHGVALVYAALRHRQLDRRSLRFFLALGLTSVSLTALSFEVTSVGYWEQFLDKIGELSQVFSAWRLGLAYVLAGSWDGKGWGGVELEEHYARYGWLLFGVRAVVVAGAAVLAMRCREPWERLVLGFSLTFCLVGALYYYYMALLVPALWLSSRLHDGRAVATLVWMFLGSGLAGMADRLSGRSWATFYVVSCAVLVQVLCMAWIMARPAPVQATAAPTPASPPPGSPSPSASGSAPA